MNNENKKLKNCTSCGKEIAVSAKTCPECGAKNKKPFYKRGWFIAIALIIIIGVISNSGDNNNNETQSTVNTNTSTSSIEATSTPTTAPKKELTEKEKMILKIGDLFEKNLAFDVGNYVMGDIPKGEYAFIGINSSKYYCEEDSAGNIVDNENFQSFGYVYVHGVGNIETRGVLVSVNSFGELGVSGAKELYEIINEQPNYTQSGMYKIGVDIPAGVYVVESVGSGYFALLTGPVGNNDIIDNDNFNGRQQITTSNGHYLELTRAVISQ